MAYKKKRRILVWRAMRRTKRLVSENALARKHSSRKNPRRQSKAVLDLATLEDLRGRFQRLSDKEVAATQVSVSPESPAPGNQGDRWLRVYAGPKDEWNRGKNRGKGGRTREVVYRLSSGLSSDFREDFKLSAILAARALGSAPGAALNSWLAACFEYARQECREYIRGATPDGGGLITRICQVSANLCVHLLQEGYEALPEGSFVQVPVIPPPNQEGGPSETGGEKPRRSRGRPPDRLAAVRRDIVREVVRTRVKGEAYVRALRARGFKTPLSWQKNDNCPEDYVQAWNHGDLKKQKIFRHRISNERYQSRPPQVVPRSQ